MQYEDLPGYLKHEYIRRLSAAVLGYEREIRSITPVEELGYRLEGDDYILRKSPTAEWSYFPDGPY